VDSPSSPGEQVSGFTIETLSGWPVTHQGRRFIPFHQVIRLRLPIWHGQFLWNRPVSVLVQEPEGGEQVLPVTDITERIVFALIGIAGLYAIWRLFRR
jgi:hypothetical protein